MLGVLKVMSPRVLSCVDNCGRRGRKGGSEFGLKSRAKVKSRARVLGSEGAERGVLWGLCFQKNAL